MSAKRPVEWQRSAPLAENSAAPLGRERFEDRGVGFRVGTSTGTFDEWSAARCVTLSAHGSEEVEQIYDVHKMQRDRRAAEPRRDSAAR